MVANHHHSSGVERITSLNSELLRAVSAFQPHVPGDENVSLDDESLGRSLADSKLCADANVAAGEGQRSLPVFRRPVRVVVVIDRDVADIGPFSCQGDCRCSYACLLRGARQDETGYLQLSAHSLRRVDTERYRSSVQVDNASILSLDDDCHMTSAAEPDRVWLFRGVASFSYCFTDYRRAHAKGVRVSRLHHRVSPRTPSCQ